MAQCPTPELVSGEVQAVRYFPLSFGHYPFNSSAMYPPFEFNNLLGPLIVLGAIATAFKLVVVLAIYEEFLKRQEDSWAKS